MRSFWKSLLTPARAAIAAVLVLGSLVPVACSSKDAVCDGYETPDGRCEKKCNPADCAVPGSACLYNYCAEPCQTNDDCAAGKNCVHAIAQTVANPATDGYFCYKPPFTDHDGGIGQFEPCETSAECDVARGFKCVDGTCTIAGCRTHADCKGVGHCTPGGKLYPDEPGAADPGQTVNYCVQGDAYPDGQFGTACPELNTPDCNAEGKCDNPSQFCDPKTNKCDDCDKPNGFLCVGSGPGDVDAYCTKDECLADSDCATGYFCSTTRTGRVTCEAACGFLPAAKDCVATNLPCEADGTCKNPKQTCDTNTNTCLGCQDTSMACGAEKKKCAPPGTECIEAAKIGDGKEYSCGPLTLLRNICLKREYCNECETDADCLAVQGQVCAKDTKGNKICTVECDPNLPNACPWGSASICDVWDQDLGVATCAHRFGSCKGTGKSCEPCLDDGDCPTGLCLSSDFSGERYCVDLTPSCDCTGLPLVQQAICTGGGCPQTPGGAAMQCYGGPQVQAGGSPLYQKCVGANIAAPNASPQTGCWPPL
ncbi:MAG: hypothetical protein KC776_27525 [Myxococcales bacterium]|nr:hypothetical protein [Myxococcales bacterium]MCB9576500.1 hypothetical protein [Polyangiaceae bacterium]